MSEKTYIEAVSEAIEEEMARDERVYLAGEDVGQKGGVFGETIGLMEKYGPERIRDTPLTEIGIAGHAFGAAVGGLRPIASLQFSDFAATAGDELFNQMAKLPYVSGGKLAAPITVFAATGAGIRAGAQHSQSLHAWIGHQPGLVVVTPTTPYDAKGLLKSAIRDDNPVVYLPHKKLIEERQEVPDEEYTLPLGRAAVEREGTDVTVVATQRTFYQAMEAAEQLQEEVSIEVVNPRTYAPLDTDTIGASVEKTGRLAVVDETPLRYGTQTHIVGEITRQNFFSLNAPPQVVGVENVPIPFSPPLEDEVLPSVENIIDAVRVML